MQLLKINCVTNEVMSAAKIQIYIKINVTQEKHTLF